MDTVIVASSQFYSHYPKRIPKGTVNAEAVLIRLDSEWDNLTVRIHWLNVASGVEKVVLLERDQPNTIPWEVLVDLSELRMGLDGMDGGTVVKPTVWLTYGYVSDGVDPESGSDPQPPTPSWEQQMVEQAEAAANAAKEAKETADNLQAAAEAGEFDGPEGPPGKSPIIKDRTWWIWSVEDQEYKNTGILASGGGGGGVSSYNNLEDRPRIGGVLLEGDKTADDLNLQPKGDYANRTDIPTKLPAPYTLTFSGAVEAAYDGSEDVTVTIPTVAGPPGVSPTVATEEIDGGTRVTFTFQGGSETADILNGKTPVKGVDYGTEEEIQEIAQQAAALVPGGGGGAASGELLLAEYIHQGNREIRPSSIDWETGVIECAEPHGLTDATEVMISLRNWPEINVNVYAKYVPVEWSSYQGKIYLLPISETSVKIVGADKNTQISVNASDANNISIDVTKIQFEVPVGWSISNFKVDPTAIRIRIVGFVMPYRYRFLTFKSSSSSTAYIYIYDLPSFGSTVSKHLVFDSYDLSIEPFKYGCFTTSGHITHRGRPSNQSGTMSNTGVESINLVETWGPTVEEYGIFNISNPSSYAVFANGTIVRVYAKGVR